MAADGTVRELVFANLPEPWMVPVVVALAVAAGWWSWRRYGPLPGESRRLVAHAARLGRVAALALIILAAAGPAWRTTTSTVLPGRVVVAIDGSASMAASDGPGGAARIASAVALANALAAPGRNLDVDYRVLCTANTGGTRVSPADLPALVASGPTTPLGDELDRLVAAQRPDLLILVSDGRVTSGSQLSAVAEGWRARDLAVAVLAVGTDRLDPELLIDQVAINREAALNELEPVAVRLSHRALVSGPITVRVLVDGEEAWRGEVAQGASADAALAAVEARAAVPFRRPGPAKVTILAESAGGQKAEQTLQVTVRERKLAVLLLESRPRYETRYLREALKRDLGVTLHSYLAEGRWRRWGNAGPEHLPLGAQDLSTYDVVVLGDLGPDALPAAGMAALEQAVRRDGAGLVWMLGETGATAGFSRTRLGELLPAELPDAGVIARGFLGPALRLRRTPVAEGLGLLEPLGTPWEELPALAGGCPELKPRPGAEVLATDLDERPLVVSRAFGSGRSILLAVDDTWRWRRNAGDRFLHRFHSQLLRFAAAGHRGDARAWRISLSPRRAAPGEMVQATLAPERAEEPVPDSASLRLVGPQGRELVVPLVREGGGFAARFPAPAAGAWSVAPAAGVDADRVDPAELAVAPPADERRDPRADPAALGAFAARCGGTVHTDPAALVAALPADLQRLDTRITTAGLWDTAWLLALVTLLFAIDWAARRWSRLP